MFRILLSNSDHEIVPAFSNIWEYGDSYLFILFIFYIFI